MPTPEIAWTDDGAPRSVRFDDVYFSADGGLDETRAVFLEGCGLPGAWAGRSRFTVGELGFGTGLNIAALLGLWRSARPAGARLHVFTVEAHPLTAAEAARALGRWPDLAGVAGPLLAAWPGRARGIHRLDLPALDAVVDVAVLDAAEALAAWEGRADAWFLDGFAPARNPGMWSPAVLAGVARRSAPGARLATYTVAGAVRRGLEAQGFALERRPGFGRKRERLEARWPGKLAASPSPPARIAVIGAGIAGAALARALRALGAEPVVFDAAGAGAGASGNPAALVTPRLDAGLGPQAALFAEAFRRAVALYAGEAVIARGALQLETRPRDHGRFQRILGSDLFEPGALTPLTSADSARCLGEPAAGGLVIEGALVVAPAQVLASWLGPVRVAAVAALERTADGAWRLLDDAGGTLAEAETVFIAAGFASARLAPGLGLTPIRGQVSLAEGAAPVPAASFNSYVIPTRGGLLFGATHDRDDSDGDVRAADQARNRAALALGLPRLAARLEARPLGARASVRASTPDFLPLAGPVADAPGLFALTGLGSRGFVLAPLLAEHVAALALGAPSPLQAALARLVDPARQR